jgi:hypothetical protein
MITKRGLLDTQEKVLSGEGTIRYRDFEALLVGLGFERRARKAAIAYMYIP